MALSYALEERLDDDFAPQLFKKDEYNQRSAYQKLGSKLDGFTKLLKLSPYKHGQFRKKILPISQDSIQPIRFICPLSMSCTSFDCSHHISLATRPGHVSLATLLEGSSIIKNVRVLSGKLNIYCCLFFNKFDY